MLLRELRTEISALIGPLRADLEACKEELRALRMATTRNQGDIRGINRKVREFDRKLGTAEKSVMQAAAESAWKEELVLWTRELMGLTQAGMADLLGVTSSTVSNWENGWSQPNTTRKAQIIELFERAGGDIDQAGGRRRPVARSKSR